MYRAARLLELCSPLGEREEELMRLVRTAYLALALVVLTVALLVAAAQAGSTNGPGAGHGASAPAQPVVVPDGCKSTTWNVTITPFPGAYHMNPLIKCGKK